MEYIGNKKTISRFINYGVHNVLSFYRYMLTYPRRIFDYTFEECRSMILNMIKTDGYMPDEGNMVSFGETNNQQSYIPGLYARNKIYFYKNNATRSICVNPVDDSIGTIYGKEAKNYYYYSVSVFSNNTIYVIPYNSSPIKCIDENNVETEIIVAGNANHSVSGYDSAVVAPNGKIYCIPRFIDYGTITKILVIDTLNNNQLSSISTKKKAGWSGGTLANNGKIYCAGATILVIDPSNDTISEFGTYTSPTLWANSVLASNGKIYFTPIAQTYILCINPNNNTVSTIGSLGDITLKFSSCGLASNGKIYFAPNQYGSILCLDPTDDSITTIGSGIICFCVCDTSNNNFLYFQPNATVQNAVGFKLNITTNEIIAMIGFEKSSLSTYYTKHNSANFAPNGWTYLIPAFGDKVVKIKIENNIFWTKYFGSLGVDSFARWKGSALAPNGKIYCTPHNSQYILVIDTKDDTISTIDTGITTNAKWCGAILSPDNKIYFMPYSLKSYVCLDPSDDTFEIFNLLLADAGIICSSGVLSPAGDKIYGIPYGYTANPILCIKLSDNTYTSFNGGYNFAGMTNMYGAGGIASDGFIYFFPSNISNTKYILKLNHYNDTITKETDTYYNGGCTGVIMAPDIWLYLSPSAGGNIVRYNPYSIYNRTQYYQYYPLNSYLVGSYGITLLSTGDFLILSNNNNYARFMIYQNCGKITLSNNALLSPYINHN